VRPFAAAPELCEPVFALACHAGRDYVAIA